MRELKVEEVDKVSGGLAPFVVPILWIGGAAGTGFAAGLGASYWANNR